MRVGIDIGGTKTAAVLVNEHDEIIGDVLLATGYGEDEVVATVLAAVTELARISDTALSDFSSVGIGIPGIVDAASGRVLHAVNLGLQGVDLGVRLSSLLNKKVYIDNDVNAAALAAFHIIGSIPSRSMAYLNLGTGLGVGLILNGSLWRGSRGTAGEIGHIPIDPKGLSCACGQHGCLELMASGSAIARQWHTGHPRPILSLFEATREGDENAIAVWSQLTESIAHAVRMLILTIDVETVVIGGGLSSLGSPLLISIQSVLTCWAKDSAFLTHVNLESRVQLLPKTLHYAAIGAVHVGAADKKFLLQSSL